MFVIILTVVWKFNNNDNYPFVVARLVGFTMHGIEWVVMYVIKMTQSVLIVHVCTFIDT